MSNIEKQNETTLNPWSDKGIANVKKCFAPNLTDSEFKIFVGLGMSLNANPFTREIWAVKYGNQAQIFLGRDFYRRKAQEQENYDGHIVNAVYENDGFSIESGQPSHKVNSFKDRGNLVGAFCAVYKKSIKVPYFVTVDLKEYNKNQGNWKSMPETMIKKVAEAQALRGAYQGVFKGTYDESEKDVIEASHQELASIEQKDKAYRLLECSNYDDNQREFYDNILSGDLVIDEYYKIVADLKENQAESLNPSMKEIGEQLDNRLNRDK